MSEEKPYKDFKPCQKRYYDLSVKLGSYKAAAAELGIKEESVRRASLKWKRYLTGVTTTENLDPILARLKSQFTPAELRAIADSKFKAKASHEMIHDFGGETLTVGVLSDTHIGSKYTDIAYIDEAFKHFDLEGVDVIVHAGDVTEGLSNRAGHVYECTEVGFAQQRDRAIEVFNLWGKTPIYMISGNHDDWYIKSAGADVVKTICDCVDGAEFLGNGEGDLYVGNALIRLWHGLDGSSYAASYRIQKIVEAFTGGDKPNVLIAGHCHKSFYGQFRHIHCISAGAIQKQSSWMRQKRLPSDTGFWILKMVINDKGVGRFGQEWFPFYA